MERNHLEKSVSEKENGIDNSRNNNHTIGMKTAISIPNELFEEVDRIARERGSSRSQVFCFAVMEYLEKLRARKLLDDLNEAYKDGELPEEKLLRKKSAEYYRQQIVREDDDDQTG
jgi:hypothetical protein